MSNKSKTKVSNKAETPKIEKEIAKKTVGTKKVKMLVLKNGHEYEVLSEDGRFFYCKGSQFKKTSENIVKVYFKTVELQKPLEIINDFAENPQKEETKTAKVEITEENETANDETESEVKADVE